jgi:type IV pilus assembly protein PilA
MDKQKKSRPAKEGFTLTELLTSISIIGILSAVALPSYTNQLSKRCQGDPKSVISQSMMQAQAYNDEFGTPATGWSDLDKIATLMTSDGPATGGSFFPIALPTCDYQLWGKRDGNDYLFVATKKDVLGTPVPLVPIKPEPDENGEFITAAENVGDEFNVVGCLNVATGASDINGGDGSQLAYVDDLTCPKQW